MLKLIALLVCTSSICAMEPITLINQTRDDIQHLVVSFKIHGTRNGQPEQHTGIITRDKFPAGHQATFDIQDALLLEEQCALSSLKLEKISAILQKIQCDQFCAKANSIPNSPILIIRSKDTDHILESAF